MNSRRPPLMRPACRAGQTTLCLSSSRKNPVLALAIACALGGLATTAAFTPGHALAAEAASQDYTIPAGKLSDTLALFAATAGVPLSFDPHLLAGQQSNGLQGRYTVRDGFAQLLSGSGYAVDVEGGRYQLRKLPAGAQADATLPTVEVTAAASDISEGSNSYSVRSTSTATRLALSPRETPQTVVVIPKQLMEDFNLTDMRGVLEFTPGVHVEAERNVKSFDYTTRGYALDTQLDGMPTTVRLGDRGVIAPDTTTLDHVEVLQGASGLTNGAGSPGGTINLVRKMPTRNFQASAEVELDSESSARLVGDISGALNKAGTLRGRIVALQENRKYFVDYVEGDKTLFYGVLAADLGDSTTLSAGLEWQTYEGSGGAGYGNPTAHDGSDLDLPRSRNLGADWAHDEREAQTWFLRLDQELGAEWQLRAQLMRQHVDADVLHSNPWSSVDPVTGNQDGLYGGLYAGIEGWEQTVSSGDVFATGPLTFFGRQHQLMAGVNASRAEALNDAFHEMFVQPVNVYTHDASNVPTPPPLNDPAWYTNSDASETETRQQGIYTSGRFSLADPAHLILGGRVSWYEQSSAGQTQMKESGVFTPYAGFVYDLSKSLSAYASYSDIFRPHSQDNKDSSGNVLSPELGITYETGLKAELLDKRLNTSLAFFRLEQENLAEDDPAASPGACGGNTCKRASGKIKSQGVDIGLSGEISENWHVLGGYTYSKAEYDEGEQAGDPYLTRLPKSIFKLASSYHIPASAWTVGGNVRYQGKLYNEGLNGYYNDLPYRIEQDAAAIFGLMTRYQISRQIQLVGTINNLFNEKYYASINDPSHGNVYGAPRLFTLNLRADF